MKYLGIFVLAVVFGLFYETTEACYVKFEKRGCWVDKTEPLERALPDLLLTDRDEYSPKYSHIPIDWEGYDTYVPDFACRCAERAFETGNTFFGLEYYGECWSGQRAFQDYKVHGEATSGCINPTWGACGADDPRCVGENFRIFVYEIVTEESSSCGCDVKYDTRGCWVDKTDPAERVLPTLSLTDRDTSSPKYTDKDIAWGDWKNYLPDLVCRCAKKAKEEQHKYFGIEFWGECWSGNGDYDIYGESDYCYDINFLKCDESDHHCAGDNFAIAVYERVDLVCSLPVERLGCFKSKRVDDVLPIPNYILSDRDRHVSVYSGHDIQWGKFDVYLPQFACRAAEKANELGYNTFGLQFWGEVWSGAGAYDTYFRDGPSENCVDPCFKKCVNASQFCDGKAHTNFVYRITNGSCELGREHQGCFVEDPGNRVFNKLVMNDLHPFHPKFYGIMANEHSDDWDNYLKGLICRCSRRVRENGWKYVGITRTGLCYSCEDCELPASSTNCYNGPEHITPCNSTSNLCSGKENSIYVYKWNY